MDSKHLENLVIAAPCSISWESMTGDDRVRHCSVCSKNVYNVSDMTAKEAEEFLSINGSSQCTRFYRRNDGTIITDNCPVGLRKLRDRWRNLSRIAAGLLATFSSITLSARSQPAQNETPKAPEKKTQAGKDNNSPQLQGKPRMGRATVSPQANTNNSSTNNNATKNGPKSNKTIMLGDGCDSKGNDKTKQPIPLAGAPMPRAVMGEATISTPTPDPKNNGTGSQATPSNTSDNKNADSSSFDLWQQGKKSESEGNFALALTYYQQAVKASESNPHFDPKFRMQIKSDLEKLKEKLFKSDSHK